MPKVPEATDRRARIDGTRDGRLASYEMDIGGSGNTCDPEAVVRSSCDGARDFAAVPAIVDGITRGKHWTDAGNPCVDAVNVVYVTVSVVIDTIVRLVRILPDRTRQV